ncbi:hypothetical protein, partial [Streptomyces fragilis]|uniref:hypothetical protein n=1 Tax=Streptomyces fragilis TaxID=67301 RepID=UPI0024DEB04D
MCIRDSVTTGTHQDISTRLTIKAFGARAPLQCDNALAYDPVSYTHLDVYKRQALVGEPTPYSDEMYDAGYRIVTTGT